MPRVRQIPSQADPNHSPCTPASILPQIILSLLLGAGWLGGACFSTPAPASPTPECPSLLPGPPAERAIYIQKASRRLGYYQNGQLAHRDSHPACFPIGLGFSPTGPKRQEGDGKTPEGTYTLFQKNPDSDYHLSLGVSYPNPTDAQAGLEAGIIDATTQAKIVKNPRWPPQNTPMGGLIYIHGGGSSTDWTLGCIAVDNDVIEYLFAEATVNMPIVIVP